MKKIFVILSMFTFSLLLVSCTSLMEFNQNGKTTTPSGVTISEIREVSGFSGIDIRTYGIVVLTQGDSESLTISGPDNIVPLIHTTFQNGLLVLDMEEGENPVYVNNDNPLTFTISVKDLNRLTVCGFGGVEVGSEATKDLVLTMGGSGQISLGQLEADTITINVKGLGNVEITGEIRLATIKITGAGHVNSPDLKIQTATFDIPGLGNATVWVTDLLKGNISGGGSFSNYDDPQTNNQSTGLGGFKALGTK